MWRNCEIEWEGMVYKCEAKVFDNPSMWGIGGGRVSKLYVYSGDGEVLWEYDRGWPDDRKKIPPQGFIDKVVAEFPNPKSEETAKEELE